MCCLRIFNEVVIDKVESWDETNLSGLLGMTILKNIISFNNGSRSLACRLLTPVLPVISLV